MAFVVLQLTKRPLVYAASESISWAGPMAGPFTAIAWGKVERSRWLELSLHEHPAQTNTRSEFRRNQKIVSTYHPQTCEMSGILEEGSPKLDLVGQRISLDAEFFFQPDTDFFSTAAASLGCRE